MKIKIVIKKERILNIDKRTPLAFMASLIYTTFVGFLSIKNFSTFWMLLLLGLFYLTFQVTSYILSRKYVILNNLYGKKRLAAYYFGFYFIFGIILLSYVLIFIQFGGK